MELIDLESYDYGFFKSTYFADNMTRDSSRYSCSMFVYVRALETVVKNSGQSIMNNKYCLKQISITRG